jgi:hypothetical protein
LGYARHTHEDVDHGYGHFLEGHRWDSEKLAHSKVVVFSREFWTFVTRWFQYMAYEQMVYLVFAIVLAS